MAGPEAAGALDPAALDQAAALNPKYVADLQAACRGLGLDVRSIVVRPCGMASLVGRQFPLADDEAYYWLWSRRLAWGYSLSAPAHV